MGKLFYPVTINFATQRVPGDAAGAPLLALVIVIAIVLPEARWLLVSGVTCGLVAGAVMIFVRRRRHIDPGGDSPTLLDSHIRLAGHGEPPSLRGADRQISNSNCIPACGF